MAPRTAQAQFVVEDPLNLVQNSISAVIDALDRTKEFTLDALAWQVANVAIQSMTKSLVTWINSGFQGSPAFVTDLEQNLRGVEDAVARRFFEELSYAATDERIARTPGQDRILDGIRLAYYLRTSPQPFYERNPSTLYEVSPDPEAFLAGDFSQGGWSAWFETAMNPMNNPYGAEMALNDALSSAVANASGQRLQELNWNRGFLSWRGECIGYEDSGESPEGEMSQAAMVSLSQEEPCAGYAVKTPGSVIMEQLNTQLGSGVNRLVSADEFDEIIGALLNQLVVQVVGGGNGGGLSGVSRPSSGGGNSYLDRATNPDQSGNGTTNIESTFRDTIDDQQAAIDTYRANWTRIRDAAEGAARQCGNVNVSPSPESVLDQAAAALAKAEDASAALVGIEADMDATNNGVGSQVSALLEVTQGYNDLVNSERFPSAEEFATAQTESRDTGEEEPASLYTKMVRLGASGSCSL
jgi:hypothetical protein